MQRKLLSAAQAGADFLCTACTYCQMQFEQKNPSKLIGKNAEQIIPAILISQLLGLSIGMETDDIGINDENRQVLMASV